MNIKMVDSTQYQQRKQNFDFDMIEHFWYASSRQEMNKISTGVQKVLMKLEAVIILESKVLKLTN